MRGTEQAARRESPPASVSAVVLTRDEDAHIAECLASVAWADEVLVLDSGSVDATVEIARQAGARMESRPFVNYADQRNAALDLARCDWVFYLDADERSTPEVEAEIRSVVARPGVPPVWWVPRHNIIFGKVIRHAGWYPDHQPRLFRRGAARWDPARVVHELPMPGLEYGYLVSPLVHYNYATVDQFLAKQMRYADLDVERLLGEGVRPRFWAPLLQPLRQFWWRFVTLEGYRDGGHGLLLSLLMAYYDLHVYRRLRERVGQGQSHSAR